MSSVAAKFTFIVLLYEPLGKFAVGVGATMSLSLVVMVMVFSELPTALVTVNLTV